jgi:chromate transport protein ChrA
MTWYRLIKNINNLGLFQNLFTLVQQLLKVILNMLILQELVKNLTNKCKIIIYMVGCFSLLISNVPYTHNLLMVLRYDVDFCVYS